MAARHTHSGRWQYGLLLSLVTCTFWGALPIMLTGLMPKMDPLTITFYRFLIAAIILFAWLGYRQSLPAVGQLRQLGLTGSIFIAGLMLALNYGLYVVALEKMTPTGAQVLIQLAPVLLTLSGIFLFKERFIGVQWMGFATFLIGLTIFFWDRILELGQGFNQYGAGMLIMIFAAIFWAVYASIQKQLLLKFTSVQLMFLFNLLGAGLFFLVSDPSLVFGLNAWELVLLFFCGINTLVAYGSFSEALEHWEASKISALFSIVPLLTMTFIELLNLLPGVSVLSEPLTWSVITGAVLVVAGAACTSLGQEALRKRTELKSY